MREKDVYAITTNVEELRVALTPQYTWYEKLFSPFAKLKVRLEEKREKKKLQHQRAKKGYAECDAGEMRTWFINTAKPILLEMASKINNHPEEFELEEWLDILKRMAHLLELMDVWSDEALRKELGIPEDEEGDSVRERISEMRMKAKEEFFSLFNRWYYHLWY